MSNMCPTSLPTDLPKDLRQWNRRALEQAAQLRAGPHRNVTLSNTPQSEARRAEVSGEAGDAEENMNDDEQENPAANGSDEDNDAESGSQAEHEAADADDAESHSHSSEAGDAEGGGEEDGPHANPDGANSGNPVDHAGTPTPADKSDDTPPAECRLICPP
eukprot:2724593-Pleurochrysis_carterae.AAC.2